MVTTKPRRPKILRDIDAAILSALQEVPGVYSVQSTGVDFGNGSKVVTHIAVSAMHQRALGRWFKKHCEWAKEAGL